MSDIALYTICNDNYIEPCCVMIYSFLLNNRWFDGDIVILHDNGSRCSLSDYSKSWLSSLYNKVVFEEVDATKYDKFIENASKFSTTANSSLLFYKIEVLKKNRYKKKLFLDSDILVNKSIKELFYNDKNGVLVVEDAFKPLTNYFNSGVMSIPMDVIPDDLYERVITIGETIDESFFKNEFSDKGYFFDQDILNEVMPQKVIIGREYNTTPNKCDVNYFDLNKIKIIHFYGDAKPWDETSHSNPSHLLYYKYHYMFTHRLKTK